MKGINQSDLRMKAHYFKLRDISTHHDGSSLLLFLIWPAFALYISLRNYQKKWSRDIIWLFCIFFGLTFIVASGEGGADSDRYASLLRFYANSDLKLSDLWKSLYSESSGSLDIVSPLITYLVSRVTSSVTFLFTIFGLIFGYFFSRNITYVLNRNIQGNSGIVIFYILTFVLINPIWNINGFRFNTAAQIFLYGALPYLLEGKKKALIWSIASIFVHFSFLSPVMIVGLFMLLRNKLNIYMWFFLLSSVIKEIDLQAVQSALLLLPDVFHSKITGYTNSDYAESVNLMNTSLNWYVPFSFKAISYVNYALIAYIYFFSVKYLKSRQDLLTLFCFSLLFYGFANLLALVPSGGRFLDVVYTFLFPFFIFFLSANPGLKGLYYLKVLSIPLLALFCMVAIRMGMDYFGFATIIGNPFIAFFSKDNVPLIEAIKGLL